MTCNSESLKKNNPFMMRSQKLFLRDTCRSTRWMLLGILFLGTLLIACHPKDQVTEQKAAVGHGFDEALALNLGADDYGMRKYVMALLKSGPNRSQDNHTRDSLQRAHLDNISRLAVEGKLVLAGPFLDGGNLRGIYVFAVETVEAADSLTRSDPAIQAGVLIMELHPWYGSAGLMKLNELHDRIARLKI